MDGTLARGPKASIIIRCFNEEQHIGRLLLGITRQSFQDYEIVVVDSGSTDRTLEICQRFPVRIVSIAPEDFSFGRSLNLGCQVARGEVIVIASAHVYPTHDDWLERMVAPFADSSVALVYGRQIGNEVTRYSEHRLFHRWFPPVSDPDQHHPFCNNANAAIRRTLWQDLAYDETLTGLEDLHWAKRARDRGLRLVYDAEATIVHVHEETPSRVFNRYRREAVALRRIMPEVRFGFFDFARLFLGNVVSDLWHAVLDRRIHEVASEILWFRFMQFWGTYKGHSFHGEVTARLKRTFYYPAGFRRASATEEPGRANRRIDYPVIENTPGEPAADAALVKSANKEVKGEDRRLGANAA